MKIPYEIIDKLDLTDIIDRSFFKPHKHHLPIKYVPEHINNPIQSNKSLQNILESVEDPTIKKVEITENDISDLLKQMSEEGDNYAKNQLALAYFFGDLGVEKNINKAIEIFMQAADNGDAIAQRNIAIILENVEPKDQHKAVEYYKMAVENKADAYALNNLGVCYLMGEGVEVNAKKAAEFFTKAAEKGDVFGKINLGDMYFLGNGIKKNYTKAFELYKEAADTKDIVALKRLAECYLDGKGTEINYTLALECYRQAMEQGDTEARTKFEQLNDKIDPQRHIEVDGAVKKSLDTVLEEKEKEAEQIKESREQKKLEIERNNLKDEEKQEENKEKASQKSKEQEI